MQLPTTPSEWDDLLSRANDDERRQIYDLLQYDLGQHIWRPQIGRQTEAAESTAFITGYGGSAGGGKSDLISGLALTQHKRSAIFRREKVQTEGIIQRITELLGTSNGYNSQKSIWKYEDRIIEFGGLDGPTDHQKWQGRPHDLKAYDEATEQREHQVRFTMGWTRSSDPHHVCRVLMTFNPPTTTEGRWVIPFFGPWLDPNHPNPAQPGELRWLTTMSGKDIEVAGPERFVIFRGEPLYDFDPAEFPAEKIITPKSRTFIPSRVTDNYFYVKSGYIDTLQSMPEPLRSQMLNGDFQAGVEDDPWQVIPSAWIDASMAKWKPMEKYVPMDSIGADIAAGGADEMIISRRHGSWFDEAITIPGNEIPQEKAGPIAAGRIMMERKDSAVVHLDVIGWGLSSYNFLNENKIQVVPVNFASGTKEKTIDGKLEFSNMRANVIWRMREALDPQNPDAIILPPDPQLRGDLASYKWELRTSGIMIAPKEDQKKRLGRSPDRGDAYCMANIRTMKREIYDSFMATRKTTDRYAELD